MMEKSKFRYIENRKAKHNYYFINEYIAGISLIGSEVKSIRATWVDLSESYCIFNKSLHTPKYNRSMKIFTVRNIS